MSITTESIKMFTINLIGMLSKYYNPVIFPPIACDRLSQQQYVKHLHLHTLNIEHYFYDNPVF